MGDGIVEARSMSSSSSSTSSSLLLLQCTCRQCSLFVVRCWVGGGGGSLLLPSSSSSFGLVWFGDVEFRSLGAWFGSVEIGSGDWLECEEWEFWSLVGSLDGGVGCKYCGLGSRPKCDFLCTFVRPQAALQPFGFDPLQAHVARRPWLKGSLPRLACGSC